MVSTRILISVAAFTCSLLPAQTSQSLFDSSLKAQTPAAAPEPVQLDPEKRADILMARKMYREAVEVYKQAPQNSAVIVNKIGIGYHQMLQMDTAKKYYEKAIKMDPKYAEAINNLGTVYYYRKSYRKCTGLYSRALKYSPNSASIYSNLGTALFARKKYQQAAVAYQKALELDKDVFEHHSSYGVLLQETSVAERAKFHYVLAQQYAKAGQNDRALQYIRKALEEGFKDKKKLLEDPDFANLRDTPEFKELLALEPRVL
jgi:tetratricopeptide (TPR) repeat protein